MKIRWMLLLALVTPVQPAAAQAVGMFFRDCEVCPEMVVVPAGAFTMGSSKWETGRESFEWLEHQVTIGYRFAVGIYEVTFDEWDACVRGGGCWRYEPDDDGWGRGTRPVINVSWNDATAYVAWLSATTGQQYRLLTEAEWEYVARAGTSTARYWGDYTASQCRHANGLDAAGQGVLPDYLDRDPVGCDDGHERTAPVGTYTPNGFGLYDVLGNVSEWVDDCWHGAYNSSPTPDGSARYDGDCSDRVYRGGSWLAEPDDLRSAYRLYASVDSRRRTLGFRVARSVP